MPEKVFIQTPYITLTQLLKMVGVVSTGGQVKWFLEEYEVKVNDQEETRRGKKLYPGDLVAVEQAGQFQIERED